MTIHDLNHMVLPQFYTWFHQLYYKLVVHRSVIKSECVLTVSEFSKKEIIRTLGLPGIRSMLPITAFQVITSMLMIIYSSNILEKFTAYLKGLYFVFQIISLIKTLCSWSELIVIQI